MDGTPEVKGSVSKAAAAGLVIVRGSHLGAIQREVTAFRWDLKRKYKLTGERPPLIHMRHLWGEKEANYDKGRNPFYGLDSRERLQIARRAYSLLADLCTQHDVQVVGAGAPNQETQDLWGEFFHTPVAQTCREIIYCRFQSGKHARRFYARISNPTMSIVAELVTAFSQFINEGGHQGVIRYDTSDASKGFEADEVYDAIGELGWCRSMTHSSHGSEYDETLLQLADLVSFKAFRERLNQARGLPRDGDPAMTEVVRGLQFRRVHLLNPLARHVSIGVHYLAARQFLHGIDPVWVEAHLKTPAELVAEFDAGRAEEHGGVHIVRQASYDHYVTYGRLP